MEELLRVRIIRLVRTFLGALLFEPALVVGLGSFEVGGGGEEEVRAVVLFHVEDVEDVIGGRGVEGRFDRRNGHA